MSISLVKSACHFFFSSYDLYYLREQGHLLNYFTQSESAATWYRTSHKWIYGHMLCYLLEVNQRPLVIVTICTLNEYAATSHGHLSMCVLVLYVYCVVHFMWKLLHIKVYTIANMVYKAECNNQLSWTLIHASYYSWRHIHNIEHY